MQSFYNRPPVLNPTPFKGVINRQLLENENSFFSSSPAYLDMAAGPLVRQSLEQIEQLYGTNIRGALDHGLQPVCDVKICKMVDDQYMGIPGWHCDLVPCGGYTAQPNFGLTSTHAFHVALTLSDHPHGVCNTEYIDQGLRIQIFDPKHVFRSVHDEVEKHKLLTMRAPDGRFCYYTQNTIHRATPAIRHGTCMYMRFSMVEKPFIANEKAKQIHIYQLSEAKGR